MSLREVFALSAAAVVSLFAELRWGPSGTQTCPHCGVVDKHRFVALQKRWRCKHCYKAFSVTSGTVFQHHKLPLQVILGAVLLYANSVKGLSALQLARDLHVQHKTAFVLLHKIRETLWHTQDTDIRAIVMANVALGSKVVSDEANGYTTLSTHWDHRAVVHAEEYSSDEGVNENQAESYIARFRRLVMGQIHHLKRKYLDVYANEVAFREDWRRSSNGQLVKQVISRCLRARPSRDWNKYWQGNKRQHDSVMSFA